MGSSIVCPSECPYLQLSIDHFCVFSCVAADMCHSEDVKATFADPKTMRCTTCQVGACDRCGRNARTCVQCQQGFTPDEAGLCVPQDVVMWLPSLIVKIVLAVIVTIVVIYVIMLAWRPIVNRKALAKGLEFREASKPRNKENNLRLYSVLGTNLARQPTTGIGVILHFRWQQYLLLWTLAMFLGLGVIALFFNKRPDA